MKAVKVLVVFLFLFSALSFARPGDTGCVHVEVNGHGSYYDVYWDGVPVSSCQNVPINESCDFIAAIGWQQVSVVVKHNNQVIWGDSQWVYVPYQSTVLAIFYE